MKKFWIIIVILVLAAGGLWLCSDWHMQSDDQSEEVPEVAQGIDTVPMLVTHIQQCAKLYTTEYRVHKIITHEDALRLKGSLLKKDFNIKMPLGDRKIAIPMDAKLKAYIDFSDFSEKNIEREGECITIVLPDPKVTMTSSKVDQKNIRQYVAFTRSDFSDAEMTSYQEQGRAAIIADIPKMGILEKAQQNAAKVLVPMLTELGYKEQNITIAFRKQYNSNDIVRMIEEL